MIHRQKVARVKLLLCALHNQRFHDEVRVHLIEHIDHEALLAFSNILTEHMVTISNKELQVRCSLIWRFGQDPQT